MCYCPILGFLVQNPNFWTMATGFLLIEIGLWTWVTKISILKSVLYEIKDFDFWTMATGFLLVILKSGFNEIKDFKSIFHWFWTFAYWTKSRIFQNWFFIFWFAYWTKSRISKSILKSVFAYWVTKILIFCLRFFSSSNHHLWVWFWTSSQVWFLLGSFFVYG